MLLGWPAAGGQGPRSCALGRRMSLPAGLAGRGAARGTSTRQVQLALTSLQGSLRPAPQQAQGRCLSSTASGLQRVQKHGSGSEQEAEATVYGPLLRGWDPGCRLCMAIPGSPSSSRNHSFSVGLSQGLRGLICLETLTSSSQIWPRLQRAQERGPGCVWVVRMYVRCVCFVPCVCGVCVHMWCLWPEGSLRPGRRHMGRAAPPAPTAPCAPWVMS